MATASTANRYDSTAYLEAYRDAKEFPKIHDDLFGLVRDYGVRCNALDLCCSIGLLGQRLIDHLGINCIGVEGYLISSREGPEYGVMMPVYELKVTMETLPQFFSILKEHQVETLVARRCISEIFPGPDTPLAHAFVAGLKEAGVKHVFLQGRQVSANSNHPMFSIDQEVHAFKGPYNLIEQFGQFAVCSIEPITRQATKTPVAALKPKSW